jgi:hypothetical protein
MEQNKRLKKIMSNSTGRIPYFAFAREYGQGERVPVVSPVSQLRDSSAGFFSTS